VNNKLCVVIRLYKCVNIHWWLFHFNRVFASGV
jgi:hypothetical protein